MEMFYANAFRQSTASARTKPRVLLSLLQSAEASNQGGSKQSPQSPTLTRTHQSIFALKSHGTNKIKHMKSSPVVGGTNLNIPPHHEQLQRSFEDLQSTYTKNIEGDGGCFSGLLPVKVASKKANSDVPPTSSGVGQVEEFMSSGTPGSPAPGYIGQQNSVVDGNSNTNTQEWTPGGPILSKETLAAMHREWEEANKGVLAEQAARKLQAASSNYQSYARVKQEYDMYNPPPREPTPTIDPPSLPPPPRRRRQLAPIVTESEPKEDPKEEGNETVVRRRKKGKSKTRSPRSAKGNTSPRTPSEVTENVFGAPESGEDSNPWPKQGLLQIQGRGADDPLAQWNRGRESFEAA